MIPSVSSLTFENIETGHAKSVEDILAFDQGQHLASCSMDKNSAFVGMQCDKATFKLCYKIQKSAVWAHRRRYVNSNLWKMDLHRLEG